MLIIFIIFYIICGILVSIHYTKLYLEYYASHFKTSYEEIGAFAILCFAFWPIALFIGLITQ